MSIRGGIESDKDRVTNVNLKSEENMIVFTVIFGRNFDTSKTSIVSTLAVITVDAPFCVNCGFV